MTAINSAPMNIPAHIDDSFRLSQAVDALSAVRDLCMEVADKGKSSCLFHVDADHFASLLGLIVGEMREATGHV